MVMKKIITKFNLMKKFDEDREYDITKIFFIKIVIFYAFFKIVKKCALKVSFCLLQLFACHFCLWIAA